ncbi:MAG TPA: asparagine synthase (glutamine-hydrolyzing) [Caulobacterales bacterium]|nr:asparagine synthase (glutamine-hydrolyzing) [Caulobacterales bacterium]
MCGIFASLGFDPDPARIDIVTHRGPDGCGWRVFETARGPLALGHRRLSIIDLEERAAQPLSIADERFWMVFNGEIYNYRELREELKAKGWVFRTESDSEVLLAAYAAWGEAALDRFLGMFAFVIWDAKDQKLFIARDRFGIKPLFYVANAKGIAFGSEIKQLLDFPGGERRINMTRAWDFMSSGVTDHTDETMFAGVRQLRGGQCLTLDLSKWRTGDSLIVRRYYDIPREPSPPISAKQAAEKFRELFFDSIKLHLRSDVPVGSCLSGGLDSSAIVCVMDRLLGKDHSNIHTFSACFPNKEVDEKPFMEAVVAHTKSTAHYLYPKAEDAFDLAEKITYHQDEPYGSTSILAQWCVFEGAKQAGIKVMLDGQGADEQLAGYHSSFYYYAQTLIRERRAFDYMYMIADRARRHGVNPVEQMVYTLGARAPARLRALVRPLHVDQTGDNWMNGAIQAHAPKSGSALGEVQERDSIGELSDIGRLCLAFVTGVSLPMLLRYEDRDSMAHSIEARVPFLDHRLVDFTIGLWDRHKIVGADTKRVLRQGLAGVLPEKIRLRHDKLGFATPEMAWFRGPMKAQVREAVEATLALYPGLFDAAETRALLNATLENGKNSGFTLWRIINFGIWGKMNRMSA